MPSIVMAMSSETIIVPPAQSITVFTQDVASVSQDVGGVKTLLATVTASQQMFGPFASGATIYIDSGSGSVRYAFGSEPIIRELMIQQIQRAPIAINAAGAIPMSALANGVITSNSLLGITCTLPAGAQVEAARFFNMDDSFDWSVIAAGLFGFTVGASTGHTIVGSASVGTGSSGIFRTRKIALNTFITYRIG